MCVRNSLANQIHSADVSTGDQVWLQCKVLQDVVLGFCYVPPNDSPYYFHNSFAAVNEKILWTKNSNGFLLLGDMKCRFGGLVKHLPARIRSSNLCDLLFPTCLTLYCQMKLL